MDFAGGYGPLTQKYGMGKFSTDNAVKNLLIFPFAACDNIVSATVVLANGKIVQASDKHNPDLLWGIKG